MKERIYFDPKMGVSGDMFTGALIDLGADFNSISDAVASLRLDNVEVRAEKINKQGIEATKFSVIDTVSGKDVDQSVQSASHGRHFSDIAAVIEASMVPREVKTSAEGVFRMLALAEAHAHRSTIEEVHFHEVGAVDAIVDIVAGCTAFHDLGMKASSGPIVTGSGQVECQHGIIDVPAPAVRYLLEGIPSYEGNICSELATPTGVALLTYFSDTFFKLAVESPVKTGYGAGTKDFGEPNVFRAYIIR